MNTAEIFAHLHMGTAIGQGVICLTVGGIAAGLCLGALLDGVYLLGMRTPATPPIETGKKFDPKARPPVP